MTEEIERQDDYHLKFDVEYDRTVNYAYQQNGVPVIRIIHITNTGSEVLNDITITITSDPPFTRDHSIHLSCIYPGSVLNIHSVDLPLNASFLSGIRERVRGSLFINAFIQERLVGSSVLELEVLAYNEWNGLHSPPEILATFVTPNHPEIGKIHHDAGLILARLSPGSTLSGYAVPDRNLVFQITAALYIAIQNRSIVFSHAPVSFVERGQQIRLPERIMEARIGNCLDLACLFAASLELAGLNPLIIITQGHTFCGVWLDDESFVDPVIDDLIILRKRVELQEIVLFDPVSVTSRPVASFEESVTIAEGLLSDENTFKVVIDIHRARTGIYRIHPIPVQVTAVSEPSDEDLLSSDSGEDILLPSHLSSFRPSYPETSQKCPEERRIESWKRHLLDISNRNTLINFQESRQNLKILHPDPALLEDVFADGRKFRIFPLPKQNRDGRYFDYSEDFTSDFLTSECSLNRLYTPLNEKDLPERLLHLHKIARDSINENGATTLYLALGFLSWYESPESENALLSPLILIPLEIERRSFAEGFTVRQGDEEIRVNSTLLHRLNISFGLTISGLDPLPAEDNGTDIRSVLISFRHAIRDIARWEILDISVIGHFSFSKYLMWRDLETYGDHILNHPLIASLNDPVGKPYKKPENLTNALFPDQSLKSSALFLLLSADSSQQSAVMAAGEGHSFALYGPPGTGKSQTITNIIAHCLAIGKTVLFVSEKKVALDVVHERLKATGLGQFCLELHSNKSNKREIITQFNAESGVVNPSTHDVWIRQNEQLGSVRSDLDTYVDALHAIHSTGESYYEGISRLAALRNIPSVQLLLPDWPLMDAEYLAWYRELVRKIGVAGYQSGHPSIHTWRTTGGGTWSMQWKNTLLSLIEKLIDDISNITTLFREVAGITGLDHEDLSRKGLDKTINTLQILHESRHIPPSLLTGQNPIGRVENLTLIVKKGQYCRDREAWIRKRYRFDIVHADLSRLESEAVSVQDAGILNRWFLFRRLREDIDPFLLPGYDPDPETIALDIRRIISFREKFLELHTAESALEGIFGKILRSGRPDWDEISIILDKTQELLTYASELSGGDVERSEYLLSKWAELFSNPNDEEKGSLSVSIDRFMELYPQFLLRLDDLTSLGKVDSSLSYGDPDDTRYLQAIHKCLCSWRDHGNDLHSWCFWIEISEKALSSGLSELVRYYVEKPDSPYSLIDIFNRSYYQQWTEYIRDSTEPLITFLKGDFEDSITQYRLLDAICMRTGRDKTISLLTSRLPTGKKRQELAELAVLSHQKKLQRKHLPIRVFLQKIQGIFTKIKPCFLMSPISVSQYLDPSLSRFDLVIFDEASQIPVWDAVGAIARGKQTIIVGDPKQLPPSLDFQRTEDEDPQIGIVNLESVLDDSIAAGVPALHLSWHYRSRHESLISFSNYHFYENRLVTFPSPRQESVVSLKFIGGTFDRGRSRTNRREAEAVVIEIVRRLQDPAFCADSIGVVTFNASQQDLILTLLEKARRESPDIDRFFGDEEREPVFVKNLENVQGDERDLILFSVGFGPDSQGRVSMNFGPLNRDGGERRLNVAITRARKEIMVFSSLHPDQIDLSLTRSEGVRLLKSFLTFARMGQAVISETCTPGNRDQNTGIEEEMAERLQSLGRSVHLHIGCGGFRIDLAVEDTKRPGHYLLGILCDGSQLRNLKTTRDRFCLQEEVLRGLGWELHRVWCSDWWDDPDREIELIESLITREVLKNPVNEENLIIPDSEDEEDEDQNIMYASGEDDEEDLREIPKEPDSGVKPYLRYSDSDIRGSKEDFAKDESASDIVSLLSEIVKIEGPVCEEYILRKVIQYWEIRRLSPATGERIRSLYEKAGIQVRNEGYAVFLWNTDQTPESYTGFRSQISLDPELRRIDEIAPQEIGNAVKYCNRENPGISEKDLIRMVIKAFGVSRKTPTAETVIKSVMEEIFSDFHDNQKNDSGIS